MSEKQGNKMPAPIYSIGWTSERRALPVISRSVTKGYYMYVFSVCVALGSKQYSICNVYVEAGRTHGCRHCSSHRLMDDCRLLYDCPRAYVMRGATISASASGRCGGWISSSCRHQRATNFPLEIACGPQTPSLCHLFLRLSTDIIYQPTDESKVFIPN